MVAGGLFPVDQVSIFGWIMLHLLVELELDRGVFWLMLTSKDISNYRVRCL